MSCCEYRNSQEVSVSLNSKYQILSPRYCPYSNHEHKALLLGIDETRLRNRRENIEGASKLVEEGISRN